ncbi:MAG: class I SAM-dependent methyltransferase [Desulfobacteraceae bacterium]|nr:MAG: class I SAM-dependent methyltransferase [Desulfobacteraceae bacterium]
MITVEFKRFSVKPGAKILDIGCGSGRHICEAFRIKGITVVGADLNYNDMLEARGKLNFHEKVGEHGGGVWALSSADVNNLPFKNNSFDLVICSEVLEHIPDHETAVFEIMRVLKPGSNLVVSVPRYMPEKICWVLSDEYHNANRGHIRIYKKNELVRLLENSGAQLWASHFAHSLHTPYWWIKCLVGPTRSDSRTVNLYHRFLVWDLMKKPKVTRFLDRLLNPFFGKSIVLYLRKKAA